MEISNILFDLTCDVTGDPGVNFFQLHLKDLVQASPLPFEISATSIGYRDRWGEGRYAPSPSRGQGSD